MKNTRYNIALLVGGIVTATFLLVLLLFNFVYTHRTVRQARELIGAYIQGTVSCKYPMYMVYTILPNDYTVCGEEELLHFIDIEQEYGSLRSYLNSAEAFGLPFEEEWAAYCLLSAEAEFGSVSAYYEEGYPFIQLLAASAEPDWSDLASSPDTDAILAWCAEHDLSGIPLMRVGENRLVIGKYYVDSGDVVRIYSGADDAGMTWADYYKQEDASPENLATLKYEILTNIYGASRGNDAYPEYADYLDGLGDGTRSARRPRLTYGDFIAWLDGTGWKYELFNNRSLAVIQVNVTAAFDTLRFIIITFLCLALVILAAGCALGYRLGLRIERSSLAEKRFFENASHEMKTPLAIIQGYAEGIETGVFADRRQTGRAITAQTDRMSRLVEDILYRARYESGAIPLRREAVSMDELVESCLMPFESAVQSRGLDVALELEPCVVSADPEQLEHALTNLFSNAVKYAVGEIRVTLRDHRVTVWNDSEPLTDDELRHIFDRFYIGRNGGAGIGLAIVKDIAEKHGWTVTAGNVSGGLGFRVDMA